MPTRTVRRAPPPPPGSASPGPAGAASFLALVLTAAALAAPGADLRAQDAHERIPPRPVEPPAAFRAAVEAGTRTEDGRPGPAYWQQRADYRIEAELEPGTGRLTGSETITYHNRSPDALEMVVLRLEQNVWAAGARRNRRVRPTGGITVENVRVDGASAATRHPGEGYYEALTLLEVLLPRTLPLGGRVEIALEFAFTVPDAPTFRTGDVDGELLGLAQWYPRMAVYDDVYGWDYTPYLGDGEFYLEYGDFDVSVTVPGGWVVGATGTLENPGEVLRPRAARRLEEAPASDETVRVLTPEDVEAGRTTRDAERLTWRFTSSQVRDFAFATSADYAWDARGVEIRGPDGASHGRALAQAFYRPHLTTWRERGVELVAHTLTSLSEWIGPYPYPQLSIAEGPTGGMEYPMFIFNPSTNSPRGLASVTIHEGAHQWFPMTVGTMEAKHAWMDEGFISYWDEMSQATYWAEAPPRWGRTDRYLRAAGSEDEVPIMRHTDLVNPYGARGLAAYTKPAVMLGALRSVIGDDAFLEAFRAVYDSWRFKHPQPWDFFNAVERHAGRDLDWFWRPLFFETDVLDHGVESVEAADGYTRITLRDEGRAILPTPVRLTMADGSTRTEWLSAESWLELGRRHELRVPGRVERVELDPDGLFPDVDRSDNVWRRP